jgi:hypothetical protein
MNQDNVSPVQSSGVSPDAQRISVSTRGHSGRRGPATRGRKPSPAARPVETEEEAASPAPRGDDEAQSTIDVCA